MVSPFCNNSSLLLNKISKTFGCCSKNTEGEGEGEEEDEVNGYCTCFDDATHSCPVCKQKLRIGDCDRVVPKAVEKTEYPEKTEYQYGGIPSSGKVGPEATTVDDEHIVNYTLGQLTVLSSGECFRLKPGRNTVGRRTDSIPHADFEIMTNSNRMSRLHIVIVVRKVVGQGYMHYVSLCGQKANATFVGDNRLEVGDCLVLNDEPYFL